MEIPYIKNTTKSWPIKKEAPGWGKYVFFPQTINHVTCGYGDEVCG
jgi:hypothetical protein